VLCGEGRHGEDGGGRVFVENDQSMSRSQVVCSGVPVKRLPGLFFAETVRRCPIKSHLFSDVSKYHRIRARGGDAGVLPQSGGKWQTIDAVAGNGRPEVARPRRDPNRQQHNLKCFSAASGRRVALLVAQPSPGGYLGLHDRLNTDLVPDRARRSSGQQRSS